ncbi:DNA-binding transcriptional regulator, PucR family [Lentzea xinjiangensis]|uniref:DNA-binding transcriptional regulator, PucR family n=1 Tax=Lentzea xinjiangensis TaxID=402600 RepID=A0A1H9T5I9_9PSEU|nr:PucR family transcriptional regulator [Lentzea xinjiangensis]SER92482.1 DNA-binding transcriptional regulator, PucR family [Lentzea xinjiangensis]
MLLLRTLLRMPELRLSLHTGEDQLDRAVTRVYGTELPDPSRYLSGGELVLSGLLWHHGPQDSETFVRSLAAARVAGLAASETEDRALPADLVDACERHHVPLLEVPVDLSFATITERVSVELVGLSRHRRLLSVVAEGAGLPALLRAGAHELGAPCWVLSTTGRVVAGGELPGRDALVREFLQADRLPKAVGGLTLVPVSDRGGSRLTSWILVVGGEAPQEAATELASLAALERLREAQGRQIENRTAAPLVAAVLSGSADVESRLAAAGLERARLRVISATTSDQRTDLAAAVLEEAVPQALVTPVGDTVYAVAKADDSVPDDVREALRVMEPGLGSSRVLVGISSPVGSRGLRGAAEEAMHARRLGERRSGRTCVVAGEEIALHQLLLAGVPEELRTSLRRRLLGPVLDYDAEHGSDLTGTLKVFLDCSGSWTAAAAKLHVHVNTLRYRVGRVEELLGVDLAEFEVRVDLFLALQSG